MADSEEKNQVSWYAMRDFTRPNAKLPAYKLLAQEGLEVFTPMKEQLKIKNGKRIRENVPVLHDLLFVHGLRDDIDPIVNKNANSPIPLQERHTTYPHNDCRKRNAAFYSRCKDIRSTEILSPR